MAEKYNPYPTDYQNYTSGNMNSEYGDGDHPDVSLKTNLPEGFESYIREGYGDHPASDGEL